MCPFSRRWRRSEASASVTSTSSPAPSHVSIGLIHSSRSTHTAMRQSGKHADGEETSEGATRAQRSSKANSAVSDEVVRVRMAD